MKDKLAVKQGYQAFNPGPNLPQNLGNPEPEGPKATVQATVPLIRPGSRAVRKEREAANASAAKLQAPVQKMPSANYDDPYDNDFEPVEIKNEFKNEVQQVQPVQPKKEPLFNKKSNQIFGGDDRQNFKKDKGFVIGDKQHHAGANRQVRRAKELREMIQLSEEENFNLFELIPQTPQDLYYNKLDSGAVKSQVTSCADEMVTREVATEEIEKVDKGLQIGASYRDKIVDKDANYKEEYSKNKNKIKAQTELDSINLQNFMSNVTPIVEKVLEENTELYMLSHKENAKKRNAVEQKADFRFPEQALHLFSTSVNGQSQPA